MTKWKIAFTEHAQCDLRNIYEYIAFSLLEPVTAKKQTGRIIKGIQDLDIFPLRCPVYDDESWKIMRLRTLLIDNYTIFFMTDEQSYTVTIVRIMYSGRNIETELPKSL